MKEWRSWKTIAVATVGVGGWDTGDTGWRTSYMGLSISRSEKDCGWDASQVCHGRFNLRAGNLKRGGLCRFIREYTTRINLSQWYEALELLEEML